MNNHISALTLTLLIYVIVAVALFGWGRVATQLLCLNRQTTCSDITFIWLGWAFTLFVFQLLHFFLPLTAYVVAPILVVGIVFTIRNIINTFRQLQEKSKLAQRLGILIILLTVIGWIASRSMLTPLNYDSGLYHFNTIRWINSFSIVPGLGNLHGRLAFNQSFFTWVAVLNFYPFFGHGWAVANGFLLLLTFATFVSYLLPALKQPSLLIKSHPFQYAPPLFALPMLVHIALFSEQLSSPTPDLACTFLQLTMFVMFAEFFSNWIKGEELNDHKLTVLTILAATAITIKSSNLVFSAVIIVICIVRVWQIHHIRGAFRVIVPIVVVILVWVCRGYVLSGAPLYPSTIGYVSTGWSVPVEKVVEEANWVYSWARQPGTHWSKVLGRWEWFHPWISQIIQIKWVVYPLVSAIVFFIVTVMLAYVYRKKAGLRWANCAVLSPVVFGLAFWFFTAPDQRFSGAMFWCLSFSAALLLLCSVQPLLKKRSFGVVLCVVFVLVNLGLMDIALTNLSRIKNVSSSGWHSIETVSLVPKETYSGLVVFTPEQGDQCWDAPLPCTPYFNRNLRLRVKGNLASGFTVKMP